MPFTWRGKIRTRNSMGAVLVIEDTVVAGGFTDAKDILARKYNVDKNAIMVDQVLDDPPISVFKQNETAGTGGWQSVGYILGKLLIFVFCSIANLFNFILVQVGLPKKLIKPLSWVLTFISASFFTWLITN